MQDSAVALFPLTSHVLPGGRLPLRIYEPRYIRMIGDAAAGRRDFAMAMVDEKATDDTVDTHYPLVTRVKLIDFDQLEDGMLGITVEGVELLKAEHAVVESDGLKVCHDWSVCPPWPVYPLPAQWQWLADAYRVLLEQNPDLAELYPQLPDDGSWLTLRWLEILPLSAADKQHLLAEPDCHAALSTLAEIIRIERESPTDS